MFIPVRIGFRQFAWPTATVALIATNVLVFVGQQFLSEAFQHRLMLRPDQIDPVTWLTSMFMHADVMHVTVNMVFLWPFGLYLESRLGWARTLVVYFALGITASATYFTANYGEQMACLGASGAIAGLLGVCLVAAPLGQLYLLPTDPVLLMTAYANDRRFTLSVPLIFWGFLWVFGQVMYALIGVGGVAFSAHFGGLASGILLGLALRTRLLPMQLSGPATEEELHAEKREQLLHTVLAAWQTKTGGKTPVDYMQARPPKFNEGKIDAPPASIRELD